jgi:RHS repeat-associated protein
MTRMPHLQELRWDFRDQLISTTRQAVRQGTLPETTYYVYDSSGLRVRKVTEREATAGAIPSRRSERLYVGAFERFREYATNGDVALERETLHVLDGQSRIVALERRMSGEDGSPARLYRYQIGNHLGSVNLELDEMAQIISYEEYYPYGSTSFQSVRSQTETPKRYRHSGKERDDETGLHYYGARYYESSLGRWISSDPAGIVDGVNTYHYVRNNPIARVDPSGAQSFDPEAKNLLNYVQRLADAIDQDEWLNQGLTAAEQGTRSHMVLEFELWAGDKILPPPGTNITRIASEVVVNLDTGEIIGVGMAPEQAGGIVGQKGARLRSVDAVLLRQGETYLDIAGRNAADVTELVLDYKTGRAKPAGRLDRKGTTLM